MKLRAGLLLERSPGTFTFPHRTFQEYLAGAHLTTQQNFGVRVAELAVENLTLWHEVILLAVGRLVYISGDTTDKPLALVGELCPPDTPPDWHKVWLAGEVLLEIGPKRMQDSAMGRGLLKQVRDCLADLVTQGQLSPRERAEAGNVLARLGDPREDVTTLNKMSFCYVPPGPFWMGSGDDDDMAADSEKPLHQVDLPYGYWISQYPVTVAQFRIFVDESGHKPRNPDSLRGIATHPVVWVTWYEAVAFCDWLTGIWREAGIIPAGAEVRLPSEREWEKAARGGLKIVDGDYMITDSTQGFDRPEVKLRNNDAPQPRFPWGNEPDPERANYRDTGIGGTSVVGAFPGGITPYGCLDMSGNVWEWCQTKWQDNYQDYQDDNDKAGSSSRVLRGGAFNNNDRNVRCARRNRNNPNNRNNEIGFRVMLVSTYFLIRETDPAGIVQRLWLLNRGYTREKWRSLFLAAPWLRPKAGQITTGPIPWDDDHPWYGATMCPNRLNSCFLCKKIR
jgi:formylglycine-generating enzyme required for sulfatase activity